MATWLQLLRFRPRARSATYAVMKFGTKVRVFVPELRPLRAFGYTFRLRSLFLCLYMYF